MTEEIIKEIEERVILVSVAMQRQEEETKDSLDELEELTKTAGLLR